MATTINSYSVGLGLDASNYIQGGRLSRQETAKIVSQINAARSPMENFGRQYDLLEKALQSGAIDLATYSRLLGVQRAKLNEATEAIMKTERAQRGLTLGTKQGVSATNTMIASLKGYALAYLGVSAGINVLQDSVTKAFDNEKALVSLEVLLGSVEEAQDKLKQLKEIDAKSPLTLEAGIQATRTLLSFGVVADRVIPIIKMLGDVTGADNERFKSMALAFAQVSAAGRLTGQDLRQMVDAGFNPLQEISRKTGETLVQLKARMEAGGIASDEIALAFQSATSEGGKFNGMMDRLGQTASGTFGQALSKLDQLKVSFGTQLSPAIIAVSDLIIALETPIGMIGKMLADIADFAAMTSSLALDLIEAPFAEADKRFKRVETWTRNNDMKIAKQQADARNAEIDAQFKKRDEALKQANGVQGRQQTTPAQSTLTPLDAARRQAMQDAMIDRQFSQRDEAVARFRQEQIQRDRIAAARAAGLSPQGSQVANQQLTEQQKQTRLLQQLADKPVVQRKR